ncbi:adhesion G protein-coupled receptor G3-like [Acipenser ruthenus]|uniref:adhesion G protein-coupled receptor G3-like n=1 Tax=Acipenser ruthenus TaxID=7906 RepID=UPI0027427D97|nr:adhesion G protein-coupled receptor G3-like [Acipenser ruthenus]
MVWTHWISPWIFLLLLCTLDSSVPCGQVDHGVCYCFGTEHLIIMDDIPQISCSETCAPQYTAARYESRCSNSFCRNSYIFFININSLIVMDSQAGMKIVKESGHYTVYLKSLSISTLRILSGCNGNTVHWCLSHITEPCEDTCNGTTFTQGNCLAVCINASKICTNNFTLPCDDFHFQPIYVLSVNFTQNKNYTVSCNTCNLTTTTATTNTTPVPSTATPASTPTSTTPMPSTATPASTPTSITPMPSTATPASTPTSTTPMTSTATPASTPTSTTPMPSTATPASTPTSTTPVPSTATPASTPTSTTPMPSTATPASTPTSTTPMPSTATPASTPTSTTPVPSTATPASTPTSTTPVPSTATQASTPTSTTPVPSTATLASTAPTCDCNFTEDLNLFPKMIQEAEKNCGSDIKSKCGVSLKLKSFLMKLLDDDIDFNGSIKIIDTDVMKGLVVKSNTSDLKDMLFDFSAQGVHETLKPTNNFTGSIQISVEALRKNSTETTVKVAVVSFAPIYFQDNNILISSAEVIGIEKLSPVSNLTDPVTISFPYNSQNNSTLRCVFRDRKDGKDFWSETGVETVYEENKISCRSYHLSFFAVLVSPDNITISAEALKSLTYISYIGCGTSFFFLCVVLFMHCMLRKAKSNNTTSILINLCAALALLNLTFLLNEWLANMNNKGLCSFIGGTMHYALLCTFTWFGIEAFHLYLLMIKVFNIEIKHYLRKLAVVGWGLPTLIVMVIGSLGKYGKYSISTKDGKSVYMCWLMDPVAQYITIIGYYAVLFVFNLVIFAAVAVRIIRLTKAGPDSQKDTVKKNACILLGLCCLLGITWGVMFFSFGPLQEPSFYIFCILNSLQGVFLFVWYYKSSQIPKPLDPISQKPDSTSSNTKTDTGRPC